MKKMSLILFTILNPLLLWAQSSPLSDCPIHFSKSSLCAAIEWVVPPSPQDEAVAQITFWSELDTKIPHQLVDVAGDLKAVLNMPGMTHGSAPTKTKKNSVGTYQVDQVYFFMVGLWSFDLQILKNGQIDDHVSISFTMGDFIDPQTVAYESPRVSLLIDVRDNAASDRLVAQGALWLNYPATSQELDLFIRKIAQCLPKNKKIYFQCYVGSRAQYFTQEFQKLGFEAYNLGSFSTWESLSLPTEIQKPGLNLGVICP